MKLWAIAALCLVPGIACGQTAAFKCPKPGTVVQYDDGGRGEWLSAGTNSCRSNYKPANAELEQREWYAPMAAPKLSDSRSWLDQTKPWRLWPLTVGKTINARYDGAATAGQYQGSWNFTWTVEKYERITTKVGTFDTFLIRRNQDTLHTSYKEIIQQWYAPELGFHIRSNYWDNQGVTRKQEAISITGQ